MIKRITSVLIILLVFSCQSAKVKKGDISYREVKSMDFSDIFYSFNNDQESSSKAGSNLIKYQNHALDSILLNESNKYKVKNKISLNKDLTPDFINFLISASNNELNSVNLPKIPNSKLLQENNTQFLLIPYVQPYLKLEKSYTSRNTILIREPSYDVKSFELKIFILDVAKNEISFYGSKEIRLNKGLSYGHSLIYGFDEIFKEFKK
jgi:hypothetical protein